MTDAVDGMVIYTDGSFRRGRAGWGIHAYTYTDKPLTKGIGIKQLPTKEGYLKVGLDETVTPLQYIDGWGHVPDNPTNNVAELQAMIEAYKYIVENPHPRVLILADSQYVKKGLSQWVKQWVKNGWMTVKGEPVANRELWETFLVWQEKVTALDIKLKVDWVKGHSGNVGNDLVDVNAKTGGGIEDLYYLKHIDPEGYHNPKASSNDLMLKKWLVFNASDIPDHDDGYHYYHMFNLGGMNGYGHKKEDSLRMRHSKTATLFGRRIADATFVVMRTKEPEAYLESVIDMHREAHKRDVVELGIACLDVAYKPAVQQRISHHGVKSLLTVDQNRSITTANDELLSITINPPRMAQEGATMFGAVERRMVEFINGKEKKGVHATEITTELYDEVTKGTKTTKKLKADIKNTTSHLNLSANVNGQELKVRALLGVDLPQRNTLNRLADHDPTVHVLVVANGPECYSFSFVFQTAIGDAIYQSPYTQFLTPKTVNLSE